MDLNLNCECCIEQVINPLPVFFLPFFTHANELSKPSLEDSPLGPGNRTKTALFVKDVSGETHTAEVKCVLVSAVSG